MVPTIAVLVAAALVATPANAATATGGISYDLDGSPAPNPPKLAQLDVYAPSGLAASASRPVVVYVHGGGWRSGDKANKLTNKINLFTGAGYVFASLNYRLSPDPINRNYPPLRVRFPTHPADVGEAIGWIDANIATFGGDPGRILLIGHSAGAHLVSLVTTDPSYVARWGVDPAQIRGTVSLDTDAYDVTDRIATGSKQTKALFYNAFATPEENAVDNTWALASPLTYADPTDPEMLFVAQAASQRRIAEAGGMATLLGQDPATSVFRAPYDHAGINDAVGSPTDVSGETPTIMDFFARQAGALQIAPSKVRLLARPRNQVEIKRGKLAKVRVRFQAMTEAASFRCRLDRAKFRRCRSPKSFMLKRGRHTLSVVAVGLSGQLGPPRRIGFRVVDRKD